MLYPRAVCASRGGFESFKRVACILYPPAVAANQIVCKRESHLARRCEPIDVERNRVDLAMMNSLTMSVAAGCPPISPLWNLGVKKCQKFIAPTYLVCLLAECSFGLWEEAGVGTRFYQAPGRADAQVPLHVLGKKAPA
jgi:hypothetical protein